MLVESVDLVEIMDSIDGAELQRTDQGLGGRPCGFGARFVGHLWERAPLAACRSAGFSRPGCRSIKGEEEEGGFHKS